MDGTAPTTWIFTPCGSACSHVTGNTGWSIGAHLVNGRWIMFRHKTPTIAPTAAPKRTPLTASAAERLYPADGADGTGEQCGDGHAGLDGFGKNKNWRSSATPATNSGIPYRHLPARKGPFLGPIYDQPKVNALRHYTSLYFRGHSVGDTNPSLLEATACGSTIAAHNNPFNAAVLENAACYFSSAEDVTRILEDDRRAVFAATWKART
jgi:hypothetical protein